jgi:hypothetical protein
VLCCSCADRGGAVSTDAPHEPNVIIRAFRLVEAQIRHAPGDWAGTTDVWDLVQAEAAKELAEREVFIATLSSVGAILAGVGSEEAGTPIETILAAARQILTGSPTDPDAI